MNVAMIGLGQMSSGMAEQLFEAGHHLTVWNRDRAKAAPFVGRGATLVDSPAGAASAGIVLTMLANDAELEAVVFGEDGWSEPRR